MLPLAAKEEKFMKLKDKLLHAVAGFLVGNIILAALIFGFSSAKNYQSFDSAAERIHRSEVREITIRDK
jgi:hypothetical protein